jgi:hypothetical protein
MMMGQSSTDIESMGGKLGIKARNVLKILPWSNYCLLVSKEGEEQNPENLCSEVKC